MYETWTITYEYTYSDNSYPIGWFDRPSVTADAAPAEEKKDIGED